LAGVKAETKNDPEISYAVAKAYSTRGWTGITRWGHLARREK
jgi:hypothetical protein